MNVELPSLESLREEERRLRRLLEHRKGLLYAGQSCGDIGSLAERLSDVNKAIASQTLCQMRTA